MKYRAAVITVSDKGSVGERVDTSGPAVRAMLEGAGYEVVYTSIVPDDKLKIGQELTHCTDALGCDLVLTTGGTGLSPAGCDARGHPRGASPGDPCHSAGHAVCKPCHYTESHALPRCGRHPRELPGRQSAGFGKGSAGKSCRCAGHAGTRAENDGWRRPLRILSKHERVSAVCTRYHETKSNRRKGESLMRIVVKVGTSTLAYPTGRLNIQRVERMCKVLSDLKNAGHEIILVSSGAIAMGFGKLKSPGAAQGYAHQAGVCGSGAVRADVCIR